MFRNYYGVPIKLHVDGEVIGILKLENATNPNDRHPHASNVARPSQTAHYSLTMDTLGQQIVDLVLGSFGVDDSSLNLSLEDQGLDELVANVISIRTGDEPNSWPEYRTTLAETGVSLLALAYLKDDLAQASAASRKTGSDERLAVTLFPPYPHVTRLLRSSAMHDKTYIKTLVPSGNTMPPLQFWARNEPSEHWLWDHIASHSKGVPSLTVMLRTMNRIRRTIDRNLRTGSKTITTHGIRFIVRRDRDNDGTTLPPFTYRLVVDEKRHSRAPPSTPHTIQFYAVAPPGVNPTKGACRDHISHSEFEIFKAINPQWFSKPSTIIPTRFDYRGEHVTAVCTENIGHPVTYQVRSLPDLLVDRLAARVQALIYSLPIPEFPADHAKTLTWAAREVANLVQKEIVFRGNRASASMPLTAVDFERLPISDLSFVDDLTSRITRAESIKPNIDHHFQNMLTDWKMVPTVHYVSRVKDGCSHLDRLGERHEGLVRGALAVWFFLLSGLVKSSSTTSAVQPSRVCKLLERFQVGVLNAVSGAGPRWLTTEHLTHVLELIRKWNTVDGDALTTREQQPSPPFADLGFFSWPWRDHTTSQHNGRDLWRIVAENLQQVGRHQEAYFEDLVKDGGLAPEAVANCVLRNHEVYVRQASSLLVQLFETRPQAEHREEYRVFYSTAFALRRFLSRPPREVEDNPA